MAGTTSKHWTKKSFQQTTGSGYVKNFGLQKPQAENQEKTQ